MMISSFSGSFRATDVTANPSRRAAYVKPQTNAVQTKGTMAVSAGNIRDTVTLSAQAQETVAEQDAQVNSGASADTVSEE